MKRCCSFVLIFMLVCPAMVFSKSPRKQVQEAVTCQVIHGNEAFSEQIARVQDSLARELEKLDKRGRFIGGALIGLAYNFFTGKVLTSAQGAATQAMERSRAKFTAEWSVTAEKDYFYNNISPNGYMDLDGLSFNGFRVVRAVPNETRHKVDTAFYLSCRIDTTKLVDLVKNSTFSLVLDTLMLDFSKTKAKLPKDRDFKLDVTVKILASWATQAAVYYQNEELGNFHITLPVKKEQAQGILYVCTDNVITGRSFIVPRSYCGSVTKSASRGSTPKTINLWGQGEYTVQVSVKEQVEDKNVMRDLLYEYLDEAIKQEKNKASTQLQQYNPFGDAAGQGMPRK